MNYFIIDFDSTFIKNESLDILFEISDPNNNDKIQEIKKITDLGMNGHISFFESLKRRIKLLEASRKDIDKAVNNIRLNISDSFEKNSDFIKKNRTKIYLVSSGFHEIIDPIAEDFNIIKNHIYANNFVFDDNEIVTGFDDKNVLSMDKGKVEIVKNLNLDGTIHVIGDGYTDYEIKKEGFADYFYLFVENIKRESLINNADFLVKSLDQFIKIIE